MILPRDKKESFYEFDDVRKEVVFHRHDMPSPWMNYLNNDEFYTMISQVITKESHEDFTEEELFPIKEIQYEDSMGTGAYGTVTLLLKDGTVRHVNFEEIEAGLML